MTPQPSKPGGYPGFGFGPLEKKLYRFLQAAARKKTSVGKEQQRWHVVAHVWGSAADARARRRYLDRLRQLQRAVNRKLRQAGDRRTIFSPRDGYLTLAERATYQSGAINKRQPPRAVPRSRGRKNAVSPSSAGRRRGLSVGECLRFLQDCLARGIRRSQELERLCCQERGCSRRIFFQARSRLGLRPVKTALHGHWELHLPAAPPPADSSVSQPEKCDTLR